MKEDPHQNQTVLFEGNEKESKAAIILLHGRGASAENILTLKNELNSDGFFFAAPQANSGTWYPLSFLAPEEENEPWISSALNLINQIIIDLKSKGFSEEKIIISGFSQGACLALEYAAKNAKKFGGVFAFSGGLIGQKLDRNKYIGSFENTVVFMGCSDVDFHIPEERVNESAEIFKDLNANITKRIYPGMEHTINQDEIDFFNNFLGHF